MRKISGFLDIDFKNCKALTGGPTAGYSYIKQAISSRQIAECKVTFIFYVSIQKLRHHSGEDLHYCNLNKCSTFTQAIANATVKFLAESIQSPEPPLRASVVAFHPCLTFFCEITQKRQTTSSRWKPSLFQSSLTKIYFRLQEI